MSVTDEPTPEVFEVIWPDLVDEWAECFESARVGNPVAVPAGVVLDAYCQDDHPLAREIDRITDGCLAYIIWERRDLRPLYVGISLDPWQRVVCHLGLQLEGAWSGNGFVQSAYRHGLPESREWPIEFLPIAHTGPADGMRGASGIPRLKAIEDALLWTYWPMLNTRMPVDRRRFYPFEDESEPRYWQERESRAVMAELRGRHDIRCRLR